LTGPGKTIGGFFGLELPTSMGALPPRDAFLLHSGRACLRAILELQRPSRFLAPFYLCDAALAPARTMGIPVAFYPIDESLHPVLPALSDGDLVMVVDYFGLFGQVGLVLSGLGDRLVIDQTQALFASAPARSWSFSSARKWFGVPDGGFLRGPRQPPCPRAIPLASMPGHLIERNWGDPDRAYRAHQAAEAGFDGEIAPISTEAVALLGGVDTARVKAARRQNFLRLHSLLAADNTLNFSLADDAVPFCYPMLPRHEVHRQTLAGNGIFIPTFWSDCLKRTEAAFAWEVDLARRLLPLPVDHRYTAQDMERVADHVLRLIRERGR